MSGESHTLRVHMTGAEWFPATGGGLNRYFTGLYRALAQRHEIELTAAAFGEPERGGTSWGAVGGSTMRRVYRACTDFAGLPRRTILDRHFCLYGRPAIGLHGNHPLVVHFHGPWAAESRIAGSSELRARVKFWLERIRYAGADRFVVLSEQFRILLADIYHIAEDKIAVIPPGVDLDRISATANANSSRTVLCVRRLERRMGIDILLHSWRAVRAAHPDAQLVIVGTGSEEASLRAQAADIGLKESISFEGKVTDTRLFRCYDEAAVTVVPTVALEGFGLVALESLAAGRAPIVTDCGGLPDSVKDLDGSLVVAAGEPDALAERIISALDGHVPTPEQCRRHAESFSWDAAAQRHVTMYHEINR